VYHLLHKANSHLPLHRQFTRRFELNLLKGRVQHRSITEKRAHSKTVQVRQFRLPVPDQYPYPRIPVLFYVHTNCLTVYTVMQGQWGINPFLSARKQNSLSHINLCFSLLSSIPPSFSLFPVLLKTLGGVWISAVIKFSSWSAWSGDRAPAANVFCAFMAVRKLGTNFTTIF